MSNLKKSAITSFAWDLSGNLGAQAITLITTVFLARILNPSDFGTIAIIMVAVGMATVFSDGGLGPALIQKKEIKPVHYSSVFYFNIAIGLTLFVMFYNAAEWISHFYENEDLSKLIKIMSLLFIITSFGSIQQTYLRKHLKHSVIAKSRLVAYVVSGTLALWLANNGAGVWSLAFQILASEILFNSIIWAKSPWKPNLTFSTKAITELWAFGGRVFIIQIIDAIYKRSDYLIIGKTTSLSILGYYKQSRSLSELATKYSSGSLMSILFPALSAIQHENKRFESATIRAFKIITFATFLLFGLLFSINEELIVIIYSEKWRQSANFFAILAMSGAFYPINASLVNVLLAKGNSKDLLKTSLIGNLLGWLNLGCAAFYGITIYLYGLIALSIIGTTINVEYAAKEIKSKKTLFYKPIIHQAIITIISASIASYIKNISDIEVVRMFVGVITFITIYLTINAISKSQAYEEVKKEINKITKINKIFKKARKP